MVAMPIEPAFATSRPYTRADLDELRTDNRRYEIIDGTLVVSAAPGRLHQRAVLELGAMLKAACPTHLEVLIAPFEVVLADDTVMEPDVLVARRDLLTDVNLPAAPELAVEVLSGSTRLFDLNVKKARFERAGMPCFWVVDPLARPDEARVIAWELVDGEYQQVADVRGASEYHAVRPFPVTVIPAALVG